MDSIGMTGHAYMKKQCTVFFVKELLPAEILDLYLLNLHTFHSCFTLKNVPLDTVWYTHMLSEVVRSSFFYRSVGFYLFNSFVRLLTSAIRKRRYQSYFYSLISHSLLYKGLDL